MNWPAQRRTLRCAIRCCAGRTSCSGLAAPPGRSSGHPPRTPRNSSPASVPVGDRLARDRELCALARVNMGGSREPSRVVLR